MKTIFFPGAHRTPAKAQYGIFMDRTDADRAAAHIVLVQNDAEYHGTSLDNTDEGRNAALNSILNAELAGVRIDFIRFTVIADLQALTTGVELPLQWSIDEYVARGNPAAVEPPADVREVVLSLIGKADRTYHVKSYDVVAGCTPVYTDFEKRRTLSSAEIDRRLTAIGYERGAGQ